MLLRASVCSLLVGTVLGDLVPTSRSPHVEPRAPMLGHVFDPLIEDLKAGVQDQCEILLMKVDRVRVHPVVPFPRKDPHHSYLTSLIWL